MTINNKWIKNDEKQEFSSYSEILLDETDLKYIKTMPDRVFNKLLDITKAELGRKALEGHITIEQAQGAITFAKYMKNYFNK